MYKAVLIRNEENENQTLGSLFLFFGFDLIYQCCTLELPNKNNQRNISRIPSKRYTVKPRHSKKYGKHYILENVIMPDADYEYLSRLMETYPVRINSSKVSAQLRDRLYWTNIGEEYRDLFNFRYSNIPQPIDKQQSLQDILTSGYTDKQKSRCLLTNTGAVRTNKESLLHRYKTTGMITIVFEKEDLSMESIRTFNKIEMERLQTVPENYTKILDVNKASDVLGDGWTVDVICHILSKLFYFD